MDAPLVLHVSNEPTPLNPRTRFARAFRDLEEQGLIRYECVVPAAGDKLPHCEQPDLLFVQSPQSYRWSRREVLDWLWEAGTPPLVVWEGDAWGGITKPLRERNLAWMRCADEVYSVAMGPQAALLRRACKRPVRYVPNTAPRHFIDDHRDHPPNGVALIGKRLTYLGVELIPGDRERYALARELQQLPGTRISLYGSGWRGPAARGPVPFHDQLAVMRQALITVGWNRYRDHTGYFSDRLPIALCAGRPHVGSRHPGLDWLPGPDRGLHLMDSPRAAADRVRDLLTQDPGELLDTAAQLSRWAAESLTETQALLHMLGPHIPLPAPPADPWAAFGEDYATGRSERSFAKS
ncbi:hypothetical protein [Streptomyces sp. NPDC050738]|uniref:glycosyltransferase family protein n=1 Tax=Streptomyces sp. NPDC050738 TaxID=3154744 RepID=UPI0034236045